MGNKEVCVGGVKPGARGAFSGAGGAFGGAPIFGAGPSGGEGEGKGNEQMNQDQHGRGLSIGGEPGWRPAFPPAAGWPAGLRRAYGR